MPREVKYSIRSEIQEKIQEMKDHFNKELEIVKKYQVEICEMKESKNQITNSIEHITNYLDHLEHRTSKKTKYILLKTKSTTQTRC